jgi:hypothetical protein
VLFILPTGIKYLLASRPEAAEQLLPAALPVLMAGLADKDDSVQAAAAEALVPMAPLLLAMQDEQVGHGTCSRRIRARVVGWSRASAGMWFL